MKYIKWFSLASVVFFCLSAAQADTDGRFLGRGINLDRKKVIQAPPQVVPAPAPVLPPAPRPVPPEPLPQAPAAPVHDAHCCKARLLKQMPAEVAFGQEFMYQLQVIACENVAEVIVRDLIPEGASYVRSEPAAQISGNQMVWALGDMDAGQAKDIRVWLRPDREGRIGSCATVFALSRACAFGVVGKPGLAIKKTGPETAVLGQDIPYTITVSNPGSAVAKAVVVTDNIPDGLSHVSGQSAVTFNVGDLPPGQSRTLPVVLKGTKRGKHCNGASAVASNVPKVAAEACTTILVPGINLVKEGTKEQFLGKSADYTLTVSNTGDTKLTNVTITDTAPAATRILNAAGATVVGNQATLRIAELGAGEKKSFTLSLTSATAGSHCNLASVVSTEGQSARAEACTLWRGVGAILVEVVDDPDPILVGNTTTYTIRITNQGSADLVNINTAAAFPAQIAPVATAQGTVTGQNVKFQTVPRLGAKQSVEFRLTARGVSVGDTRVKFTFTEDTLTSPIVEEESTRVF